MSKRDLSSSFTQKLSGLSRKINNDPDLRPFLKLIFMENYNVSLIACVTWAADLSQQIFCYLSYEKNIKWYEK